MAHEYKCDYQKCPDPLNWFNTVVYHLTFTGPDEPALSGHHHTNQFHWKCLKEYTKEG